MTTYLVLKRIDVDGEPESWQPVAEAEGSSTLQALRNGAEEDGTFVAVPARSWQPIKVSISKAIKLG